MSVDLGKLSVQGRAYNGLRPWTPEELDAVLILERERQLTRAQAADYVRNGIFTLDAYDAALSAGFQPKTLGDAAAEAETILKDNDFSVPAPVEEVVTEPAPVEEAPVVEAPVEEAPIEAPVEEAPVVLGSTKSKKN